MMRDFFRSVRRVVNVDVLLVSVLLIAALLAVFVPGSDVAVLLLLSGVFVCLLIALMRYSVIFVLLLVARLRKKR